MTASGEANMDIRDAMLTPPMNSCRAGWSRKAMLACATSANTKTSSTRIPMIFSCGEDEEHTNIINHPGKHRLLQKWRERERKEQLAETELCGPFYSCRRVRHGKRTSTILPVSFPNPARKLEHFRTASRGRGRAKELPVCSCCRRRR